MRKIEIKQWDKYNRLTIIEEIFWKNIRHFRCKCICWNIKIISLTHLRKWETKSCWCYNMENLKNIHKTHWMAHSRIRNIWIDMKRRCDIKNRKYYEHYWWRWITYDSKWQKFEWFYKDMIEWYSDNLTLDRIDNNWNYCKENCRWATNLEQWRNKRSNVVYKWKCLSQWCEELWLNYNTVHNRIYTLWWDIEKSLQARDIILAAKNINND